MENQLPRTLTTKRLTLYFKTNRRLKHMYAELALDNKILKDVLSKKF